MPSESAATFYLDEPAPGDPTGPWSARRNARTWRFMLLSLGGLLAAGGGAARYMAAAHPAWTLCFVMGLLLVARALFLWRRRPFLRIGERGLTFRLSTLGRTHAVHYNELTRLEPTRVQSGGVELHRAGAPTMHLTFAALAPAAADRLGTHLADTARQHGVSVPEC